MTNKELSTYISGYTDTEPESEHFDMDEIIYWNHQDFTYRISALLRNWQFLENHFEILKKAENLTAADFGFTGWEEEMRMSYSETCGSDLQYLPVLHRAGTLTQLLAELDELLNVIRKDLEREGKPIAERKEVELLIEEFYAVSEWGTIRDSYVKYLSGVESSFRVYEKRLSPEFILEAFHDVHYFFYHICKMVSDDS